MGRKFIQRTLGIMLAVLVISAGFLLLPANKTAAVQSVPYQMNFQGRLNNASGAPMAAGTYNMKFTIYSAATGGTALWTETHAVSASQGVSVTMGGLFTTQLGSVTGLPPAIFNSSAPLYLEVELPTPATATSSSPSWTEGAMSPRNPIESSPYAINSDLLDGMDSSAFALASGSTNYIQNTSTPQTANFNISGTGTATALQTASLDTASTGVLTVGSTNATTITLGKSTTNCTVTAASGNLACSGTISTAAGGAAGTGTQQLASNLYVQSRAQNLVTNGTGLLGNNYNFSGFTFDPTNVYAGGGSFKNSTYGASVTSDELIPVDPSSTYQMTLDAESTTYVSGAHAYFGLTPYDIDGNVINPSNYMKYAGSTDTTLAAPLNPGDTTVQVTNATGWSNSASGYSRNFVWYGYTNSKGYTYPNYTYTRTGSNNYADFSTNGAWAVGGISGNTITLRSAWAGPAIPAGTAVRNNTSGSSYKYIAASNVNVPASWTTYSGRISGIDTGGTGNNNQFPYGTAYAKLLFLMNRDVTGNVTNVSDISFTNNSGVYTAPTASTVPTILQGAMSQTADLLQLQNSSSSVLSKFNANGDLIVGGTSSAASSTALLIQNTSAAALLTVNTSANNIVFGSGSNTITFTASGGLVASGTAEHVKTILLPAEYTGAVLDAASDSTCTSANNGTMTSGYDSTNRMNFYNWTSTQASAQCYNVVVQVPIPSDFDGWTGTPSISMKKDSNGTATYAIKVIDSTGTTDSNYNYASPGTIGTTWANMATSAFGNTSGTNGTTSYVPGSYFTIKIRMSSTSGANVSLGNISLTYNSKF